MEKKGCRIAAICLFAFAFLLTACAGGEEPPAPVGRDPAFEQEIQDRLAAINPAAVPVFQAATEAMDGGDPVAAREGYERVLELAPDFPDALRRLSYVELEMGNVEAGLSHARQALAIDSSPHSQAAVAHALLYTEDRANWREALGYAWAAVEALPEDDYANAILLYVGAVNEDWDAVRQGSETLVEVAPWNPGGHFYAGLVAAHDGQWESAEQELLRSRDLGMPEEMVQEALDSGIASQALLYRSLRWGGYTLVGWLASLLLLFLVGLLLSQVTLAATRRVRPVNEFQVGRAERVVRAVYRVVIALTSLYFYASIPLLIVVVLAAAAGVFYFFLVAGSIPIRIALFLALAVIYTLFVIVRSVFTRVGDEDPGRLLPREQAPQLWAMAEEVAERVGTRPVDAVYVTPVAEIGVTERGSLLQKLRGEGRRCLILGLGALPGMTQGQFRAVLAHEYGHFSSRDTAGGGLARWVRFSMHQMAYGLARGGQAHWYNPVWLFLNGFHRVFLRITLGASRLQEILADRYAALAYGVQNFIDGLTHIVRQGHTFRAQVSQEVMGATGDGRALRNLYLLPPMEGELLEELERRVDQELSRPTSAYDSHPAIRERISLLEQIGVSGEAADSPEPMWELLPDAEGLQREMTAIVYENVQRQWGGA